MASSLCIAVVGAATMVLAPAIGAGRARKSVCDPPVYDRFASSTAGEPIVPTWHSAIDSATNCAFTHEHGSDPSRFIGVEHVGAVAFGKLAQRMGMTEPHEGFKVYVVNNAGQGKAWMIVLHQGTAGPKRATQPHHSLDLWMV